MIGTRTRRVACALALAAALGACGGGGGTTVGGSITIYSGRSEGLVAKLVERFEKATGVDATVRYGETAEMAATILEEGSRSPADVFYAQDAGALGAVHAKGLLRALPGSITSRVGEAFRSRAGTWVGTSGRVRVLAYSPTLVTASSLPASVEGLTAPAWKGKVGWAPTNGSFQAFVTAFRRTLGDAAARAWLERMKANGAKAYPNNDSIAEAIAEQEIPSGLLNHYYPYEIREENPGAKIEIHFFGGGDVGGLVNVAGAGVLASSKNRPAAERFISYMLSAEGQRYFVENTWEYPLVEGVEPFTGLPPFGDVARKAPAVDLDSLADLEGTLDLLREVGLL